MGGCWRNFQIVNIGRNSKLGDMKKSFPKTVFLCEPALRWYFERFVQSVTCNLLGMLENGYKKPFEIILGSKYRLRSLQNNNWTSTVAEINQDTVTDTISVSERCLK
ncbi:uncharacterized protein LOC119604732 [Lucilia sericata]|uniref:uncharacterized protein LOC119604732 n=1 Tax=Lucilia sericata TaxID=13632 RepID=UPI0018A84F1A|nr:uncharacterized protein LOC119604732 [Lucilia sericata]